MVTIVVMLMFMATESGLERGAAGMQGTPPDLPPGAFAQREKRIQGKSTDKYLQFYHRLMVRKVDLCCDRVLIGLNP